MEVQKVQGRPSLKEEDSEVVQKIYDLYHITKDKGTLDSKPASLDVFKCLSSISDSVRNTLFQNELNQKELHLLRKERYLQDKHKLECNAEVQLVENKENVI